MRPLAAFALTALLLFAGCVEQNTPNIVPASTTGTDLAPQAPRPIVTDETGSVTGFVVDDELLAVAGASVILVGTDHATVSALDGSFTINGIAPGAVRVNVTRAFHEDAEVQVDVIAGTVTDVVVNLRRIGGTTPHAENWQHDGYMELGIGTPVISPRPGTQNTLVFSHDIFPGLNTTFTTMTWTATTAFSASRFRLAIDTNGDSIYDAPGRSPHVVRLEGHNINETGFIRHDVLVPVTCNPTSPTTCLGSPPNSAIDPVSGQRFTIYVTAFYLETAPADFSNAPDA